MSLSPRPAGSSLLNASPLVQWLCRLELVHPPAPASSLAAGLSPWLGWTDAIALSAALAAPAGQVRPGADSSSNRSRGGRSAEQRRRAMSCEVDALRADLSRAIEAEPAFSETAPVKPPAPSDASALRGHVRLHQRAMAERIALLRGRLRHVVAEHGPEGANLAALDAVLERALAARERQLLDTLPACLSQAAARPARPGEPAVPAANQARALLLAELAHRLQPLQGMLQALHAWQREGR